MKYGRNGLLAGGISALAVGVIAGGMALPAAARDMTQTRLENAGAEPDNWLHVNGNYAAHRFANLTQINKDNVRNLQLRVTTSVDQLLDLDEKFDFPNAATPALQVVAGTEFLS